LGSGLSSRTGVSKKVGRIRGEKEKNRDKSLGKKKRRKVHGEQRDQKEHKFREKKKKKKSIRGGVRGGDDGVVPTNRTHWKGRTFQGKLQHLGKGGKVKGGKKKKKKNFWDKNRHVVGNRA